MGEEGKYHRWALHAADLLDMTPLKARDLIVQCFFEAQKETFVRAGEQLGRHQDPAQLMATVRSAVKMTFQSTGGDFEAPTRATLEAVVEALARKASTWGTPEDVMEHHKKQIQSVLRRL